MAKTRKRNASPTEGSSPSETSLSPRQLVVVARAEAGLRAAPASRDRVASASGASVRSLSSLLRSADVHLEPLFGSSEERVLARTASVSAAVGREVPDLSVYYHVEAPDERLDELADSLRQQDAVDAAYVKPPSALAVRPVRPPSKLESINEMLPRAEAPPTTTPDFTPRQIYLDPAPEGIDARYAWTRSGGKGEGIKILDCEWGWRFTHEDLLDNQMGVVVGVSSSIDNHGTAVLGEISGDHNAFGISGICPNATVGAASLAGVTSRPIRQAADKLRPGDILLLEIHRPGPEARGTGQFGFIAIEWWPDDFAAIQYAVSKGIIVVEAAGNGYQDLDGSVYDQNPESPLGPFPDSWRNPFNPANPSSGAVLVGAGAPPPGTHGRDHGPDRSRLLFSNFGERVDCQGWGREVTSTGYGDLQGGSQNEWYTDEFSGTSSASPIVVGALGCAQGILLAEGKPLLDSPRAREVLRATGSPQQDYPSRPKTQRIGNRPDLRQIVATLLPKKEWHPWEDLGGFCTDGVGVASWGPDRLDCFSVGNDHKLYHKWWDGSNWSAWENLGGQIYSAPTAISRGPNLIDVFALSRTYTVVHKRWDGSSWSGWDDLGGFCTDGVGVASWGPDRLDCFSVERRRFLQHKFWDGSSWSDWQDLGGQLLCAPAAVSRGPHLIDVFAFTRKRTMWRRSWNGSSWQKWQNLGGMGTDGIGVASWGANRLDCFMTGNDRKTYHKWWDGSSWNGWENLGGQSYSAPAAVSRGTEVIDVFAIGENRSLWHRSFS